MKKVIIGWVILLILIALALIFFIWQDSFSFLTTNGDKWLGTTVVIIAALVLSHLHNLVFLTLNKVMKFNFKLNDNSYIDTDDKKPVIKKKVALFSDITEYIRRRYGFFWRRKVRKCLVLGDASDTEKLLPNLTIERWQLSENTLMIYGGDVLDELNGVWLKAIKKRFGRIIGFRRKPLDAFIWVLPDNYLTLNRQQQAKLEKTVSLIQERYRAIGWQVPIYLVSSQSSEWLQTGRVEQGVGTFFTHLTTGNLNKIDVLIEKLAQSCCYKGMEQVVTNTRHSFLLQLSQDLIARDKQRIKEWLSKWIALPKAPSPRGLLFTPLPTVVIDKDELQYLPEHRLEMTPTWQTISDDAASLNGHRTGIAWDTLCCSLLFLAACATSVGLMTSFYQNQTLITNSTDLVNQVKDPLTANYADQLQAQYNLQLQMGQLIYRQQDGVPVSYRFGLDKNNKILDALWPHYLAANERNIGYAFYDWQENYLLKLTELAPSDPNRSKKIELSYEVLKAYLMLSNPDKMEPTFVGDLATRRWPVPRGNKISITEWQRLMPDLVVFWGKAIQVKPDLAMSPNKQLVKDVRQILINQIGMQNAENTIYQAILQRAGQNYANLTLSSLLGDIDSRMLFNSTEELPGVFTREAWEDSVEDEIANAAKSRQEQIDWVLSDNSQSAISSSISPDILRKHLTDRYFNDYSAAWLVFLNNIKWRQADNIADVIEQLTLMSDVRQSPVIALMNEVKYQAEVAYTGDSISDNLVRSAQDLIKSKRSARVSVRDVKAVNNNMKNAKNEASGPLTPTFGVVLNLMSTENSNALSLQAYLLRVTQVRLKLQNITSSGNPQVMAKILAKSVFQGTSVDLTETRDYGNLIAANLGDEWSGFGYNLFKRPLEQAWQVVLTPAANSFNETWQQQIAYEWEKSFAGRYPFKDSESDASLAELARFLRPDAGVIDRFITSELSGVLEKQGDNWVINPVNAQGINFSPEFIDALNLFNELSHQVIHNGDAKMSFDLMARSGSNIVRSELIIDKQKSDYYNQMPTWKRFNWPGDEYSPHAQLSWSSDASGLRLYDYYAGDWAWIRLLESASVRRLDSSRYELVWSVPGDGKLKYILRSQSGEGPMTLLKLRNFTLPKQVFDVSNKKEETVDIAL